MFKVTFKYKNTKITQVILISLFLYSNLCSQTTYNSFVDSVISLVDPGTVSLFCRELSGDTSTIIGGLPYTIISRHASAPGNEKAAQYIFEKFLSMGLDTRYQIYTFFGRNVIGKKTGIKYPNQQFIICGHYDNITYPISDTIPGADDNASGVSCVIEAARVLSQFNWDYTLIFVALDEEEGYGYGSDAYADSAALNGDSILGVINLDMIAYDSDNDNVMQVTTNIKSMMLAQIVNSACFVYQPLLKPEIHTGFYGSDQISFWEEGFRAVAPHEFLEDFNRFYHTVNDKFMYLNVPYLVRIVKSVIASVCVLQNDFIINFYHQPIKLSDTTAQNVIVTIKSNHRIAAGYNAPRLYYNIDAGAYNHVNAYFNNQDTFKFLIPGQSRGKMVQYYIAAQDSAGTQVGSIPAGARGINPPGVTAPPVPFKYYVIFNINQCSNSLPRLLPPMQLVYDTIAVSGSNILYDLDVNLTIHHSNDSNLFILLLKPGYETKRLSYGNGGSGDNYINTTFDDEAFTPIKYGSPPFTGFFKPEESLTVYDGHSVNGYWILRIFNSSSTVSGELINWCVNMITYSPIGITNNQIPVKSSLSQNYPNPFNSGTRIKFSIPKPAHVRIVVYDVLGREVRVLLNNSMNYGEHNISFDANELASGLYFYSMFIDGSLLGTKKMVLVK